MMRSSTEVKEISPQLREPLLSLCLRVSITLRLAHMLDSLVRVSRRADDSHFVSILTAHGATDTRRARRVSVLNTARAGAPQAGPVRCIGCLSQRQRSNARL